MLSTNDMPRWIIGIGAQKAGSTWLGEYFSSHPEVLFSPLKELHFFDQIDIKRLHQPIQRRFEREFSSATDLDVKSALLERLEMGGELTRYVNFFNKRRTNEHVFCEVTPSYSMLSEQGIKRLKQLPGEVKCIFILRNPVDRVWSQLKMKANLFGENLNPSNYISDIASTPDFFDRTDYPSTLRRFKTVLGEDNLFVAFYEDLFGRNGTRTIKQLNAFCRIESFQTFDLSTTHNEGANKAALNSSDRLLVLQQLKSIYYQCEEIFGYQKLPKNWQDDLNRLKSEYA